MITVTLKNMSATMRVCASTCLSPLRLKCCDRQYEAFSSDACDPSGFKGSALFFATHEPASCFTTATEAIQVHKELKN